ncbi:hypothetical protein [Agreia bicolorata]|uniref:Uncharacterized protein n=1 Tax=Agreia bicolorata TaxID=110935 RepID=A0ABR5CJI9_9MICO|nr:hypothetical protein [Agreia bicolorata]KJC65725.1 hypothetical protein TZ00_02795 [Agreia bicolorata]
MTPIDLEDNALTPEALTWIRSASEDQLLSVAGSILIGDGRGFGGRDDEQNRHFASEWIEARLEALRPVLCTNNLIQGLGGELTNDILTLVPLLATHLDGNALLTAIVACIVLRRGLAQFCAPG